MGHLPVNHRLLRHALVGSVALHGALLLIFTDFLPLTVMNMGKAAPVMAVRLHQPILAAGMVVEKVDITANVDQGPRQIALSKQVSSPRRNSVAQSLPPSLLSDSGFNVSTPVASESAANATVEPVNAEVRTPGVPDADDLRTYRLNLSREARRYKRYPAIARERGLEGVVVVVISTRAGLELPQVSLSKGSGEAVLDLQALEMVSLAVRHAAMPEPLRQRDFGIDLPIHFSLND